MATLANASTDFVEVLRRGLDAYDAGDHEHAYEIFGEALEIEPDNVWGLLWKGATAPSPADTRLWLEQALALEPDNEHARAGLDWANEALAATGEPFEPYETPAPSTSTPPASTPSVAVNQDTSTQSATFSFEPEPETMPSAFEAATPEEGEDDLPDWMRGEASPAAEMGTTDAFSGFSDMVGEASSTVDDEDELPDWLTADTSATAADDLPDWMQSSTPTANDEDDLPDWLKGETVPSVQTDEDDLPDWLRDDTATATVSDDAGLPNWLDDEEDEVVSYPNDSVSDALPSWLDEELEPEAAPAFPSSAMSAPAPSAPLDFGGAEQVYRNGLMAYEENRLDDAVDAFMQALQLDPNHIEAHNYLGSVYFLQGRTDEAIQSLRRALDLDPTHTESHLNLGLIYQETGQVQEAIRMFRRYLELAPDSDIATDVEGFIRELGG